jgi:biopolymer transport protein TolR
MVLPKVPTLRAKREVGTALSEINVTPFVDVMLVLLVIFMVTAPMMQSGIGVNLPTAETDTAPAEEGLTLTVDAERSIYLGLDITNINLLENKVRSALAGKSKKVVFLKADQSLPYGFIVDIMDVIMKAGVETLGIIAEPEEKKKEDRR